MDGFPAVDYVIAAEGSRAQARAILAERRLYIVTQGGTQPDEGGFRRLVELVDA